MTVVCPLLHTSYFALCEIFRRTVLTRTTAANLIDGPNGRVLFYFYSFLNARVEPWCCRAVVNVKTRHHTSNVERRTSQKHEKHVQLLTIYEITISAACFMILLLRRYF